ncbi:MAG: primosomal protein N' [Candidatus Omnitrophica bacterium]|nr:primosomal protein N' [Candidatus Omnitrophota bacterium]
MFAKVLVNLPVEGPFDYKIPKPLQDAVKPGCRVWVSFGPRRLVGYVVGLSPTSKFPSAKEIEQLIETEPILDENMLNLTKQMSRRYLCSWGEAIDAAIPSSLKKGKVKVNARKQDVPEHIEPTTHMPPSQDQKKSLEEIYKAIEQKQHQVFLLHGITGSGKTEVYLQAIEKVLSLGKACIVLVPEISLTPQAVERFHARYKEKVATFHSRLTQGQKYEQWKKIKDGICHIVIGTRSAIFSPVKNLGLVVVDEEHDTSYKQQDTPRYNAVWAAVQRAQNSSAVVILGSATPSLESYYKAKHKEYRLVNLRERIEKRALPVVNIVDMRKEIVERKRRHIVFSRVLNEAINKTLDNNEQAILFLNRRGFSTYANCKKCGYVFRCRKCNVALNFHSDKKKLICHYCNYQIDPVDICPECRSSYLNYFGFGTQRVESELHKFFPTAAIGRMDTDSMTKRQSHKEILKDFASGKYKILVGTQMVAKGHDFGQVTLVGVISADTALNLPDFRAGERTFQLLAQVAGRAGRGSKPGRVIIQTYTPHHYAILCSVQHDYESFYEKEILLRKELLLPPFSNMIVVTLRSYKEEKAKSAASELAKTLCKLKTSGCYEVAGPVPDMIYKLRRQFRWNVILKVKNLEIITEKLKDILKNSRPSGARLTVDVDPL